MECRPQAVEPLSDAEQVPVNPQPYFVPSTVSASEVLTNVAIQDLLAQDAEFYDMHCHSNIPVLTSVSGSWNSYEFDFVNPFARDDSMTIQTRIGKTWRKTPPMALYSLRPSAPAHRTSFEL